MRSTSLEELAGRLEAAERSLEATRAELRDLRVVTERGRRVRIMTHTAGAALLGLTLGAGHVMITHAQGQAVTAPFTVTDSEGHKMLEVAESSDGQRNGLRLFNRSGGVAAVMRSDNAGRGVVGVADPGGAANLRVMLGTDAAGNGAFQVFDHADKPMADIFRGPKGGQGLGLYDSSGTLAIEMGGWDGASGSQILLKAGTTRTRLHAGEDDAFLQFVTSTEDTRLWLGYGPNGRRASESESGQNNGLLVYGAQGAPVAEVRSAYTGGGATLRVLDAKGVPAVAMTSGDGGRVVVADDAGKVRIALNGARADGGVSVFGESTPIAYLGGEQTGHLELSAANGQNVVEAGMTDEGRGVVRVGPYMGGPVGLQGLPTAILGKLSP